MIQDRKEHRRRSIRLPGYDYASAGFYFVTICARRGECLLGEVVDGEMHINDWGQIASQCWSRIPDHFQHVELDAWVVMPNHMHGIIVITSKGEASPASASSTDDLTSTEPQHQCKAPARDASPLQPGSLGAIVGNFKSVTTRRINRRRDMAGTPFWQRNYWEHIIRNQASLDRIREYIEDNPACWADDQLHPDAPPNRFNQ